MLSSFQIPGAEPTVVLMHGVFMDHTLWDSVTPALQGRRIVSLDMPGHGASPGMDRPSAIDDHVEAAAATLDGLGLSAAVVAGHSWGGMVGVRLAQRRPDLVSGLVLTNTPLLRTRGAGRLGFLAQHAVLGLGLPIGVYGAAAAKALHGPAHLADHPATGAELTARLRTLGRRRIQHTIRSVILDAEDTVDTLAQVAARIPVRVLGGASDYAVAEPVRSALAAHGIQVEITEGGHTGPAESPTPIAAAIEAVGERGPSLPPPSSAF